jgi:hypothetical protein
MHAQAEPFRLTVELTARQQQQLVAASDALGVPLHQVGEAAIEAFLEQSGHHRRGQVRRAAKPKRARC